MRLKDKVALITGAGQGIGRATALSFAREGAIVAVADINMTAATAVADEIIRADGRAKPLFLDVARAESVEAAVRTLQESFGRVDVLVPALPATPACRR
jgi:3-oxoacyl-[acyl-carrier protein] reductase